MADNDKLDNQRLKNFKNKGRDLEVDLLSSPTLFSEPGSDTPARTRPARRASWAQL